MENLSVTDARAVPFCDGLVQLIDNDFQERRKLILEDLDSYLQDINDRLTISRMVSDCVIKGMFSAVKQEADEKIAQKEMEVAELKGMLHLYHVDVDEKEFFGSPLTCHESKSSCHPRMCYKFSDNFVENDRLRESMGSLRNVAKCQFKMLKKEIDRMRGFSSIRRIGSGSGQLGLDGILQDKLSERLTHVDVILEALRATIDYVYIEVEDMFQLSKESHCAWQQEREFQAEIEGMVIKNCIRSLQEEFEERLWDQNARFCGNGSVKWLENIQEISSLRQELDDISKSVLSVHEIGQLTSVMSLEIGEEYNNNKSSDHSHCKVLSNHGPSSSLVWEGNVKHEDTKNNTPESSDPAQLKLMSKDELVFEMTKMRRNHESKVQEMTEKNFHLKRERLRLKKGGSSLPLKKDKEFDLLRTKISRLISRLAGILVENEALHTFSENADNIGSLKDRLESLKENRHLRDSLFDKKKEDMSLTSQVSDAEDKMSYHHLTEANLLCDVEDAHIKHSISEDVYKCALRELMCQINWVTEESDLQCNTLQDIYKIIFNEAIHGAELSSEYETEDSDMESIITQQLCGIIYREALKDAEEKVSCLNTKYVNENKIRVSLEVETLEKEKAIGMEVVHKERLKKKIHSLAASLEEKSELLQKTMAALAKEKEQFEAKMCELNQKLELAMEELRGADKERKMLHASNQEKDKSLSLVKVKERENQMQMKSIIVLVRGLSKAFVGLECRVTENISNISQRLENLISESRFLIPKANLLQRTGLLYKQRLERNCSDLEKAEVEVDLLGDEVGALLSLLEKVYIGLDHYSPVLQHYPGVRWFSSNDYITFMFLAVFFQLIYQIIDTLKLVKRKLSGESTRSV